MTDGRISDAAFEEILESKLKEATSRQSLPKDFADRLAAVVADGRRKRWHIGVLRRCLAASFAIALMLTVLVGVTKCFVSRFPDNGNITGLTHEEDDVLIPQTCDFTWEGWVWTKGCGAVDGCVLGVAEWEHDGRLLVGVQKSPARSTDGSCFVVTYQHGGICQRLTGETVLKDGWSHFAFVRCGEQASLYINGHLELTSGGWFAGGADDDSFQIAPVLKDGVSEVRVWNEAKSQDELVRRARCSLEGNEPGLVAYWPLSGPHPKSCEPFPMIGRIVIWRPI